MNETLQLSCISSFVDAILDDGHMSDSTPYMLVLWAQEGDSEMFVSICDHHDTLNLCSQSAFCLPLLLYHLLITRSSLLRRQ